MASGIDMTLDDLIKKNKQSKPSRGFGDRSSGPGGPRGRNFKRRADRPAPYSTSRASAPNGVWQHDLFASQAAAQPIQAATVRASAIETGTKLYISNLDYGVSNEDIKELFSEVGDLKRYGVHYDRSGRSKGTADVVFARKADALAALKRYNNVQLDAKAMKIEIVGTNVTTSAPRPASVGMNGNQNGSLRSGQGQGGVVGLARGGGRGARRGRRWGQGTTEKVSIEDLDAELEKYHAESMETS
ncbi:hypothetical protein Nepgr_024933 [Nepenthes gracilis]|uniref:RRM domain-containing protein n=1 Tax=Nepenthes gracilis TaxID=150966 RepID=A0AAD3T447_NEPGR|nr:hypothetical protein Nepgr_024933 [Nepenthes gracilis]